MAVVGRGKEGSLGTGMKWLQYIAILSSAGVVF